jgi:hypothetical protein
MGHTAETCKLVHEMLERVPGLRFPFPPQLPNAAIYFLYEDGQYWGHGGDKLRIVQIGTHTGKNFGARLAEHFLPNDRQLNITRRSAAPKDRSVLRKMIGRAFLSRDKDHYLDIWNLVLTSRKARDSHGLSRDIAKERDLESQVTDYLRSKFSMRYIEILDEQKRLGPTSLTRRIIATRAQCGFCAPTPGWLGSHLQKLSEHGLWQVHYTSGPTMTEQDVRCIEEKLARSL